ncbi:hypothetical protein G5714_018010 [Onychostoma macrolepis]|uniref:Uncharacterized protein n=1 Tax=Onychostoma macrolepis TaxID=369639 RepID=A0A7J6C2R3_9TELE|nr:hypothetical protein G5714_018010 [Onychostoma macrolepis]
MQSMQKGPTSLYLRTDHLGLRGVKPPREPRILHPESRSHTGRECYRCLGKGHGLSICKFKEFQCLGCRKAPPVVDEEAAAPPVVADEDAAPLEVAEEAAAPPVVAEEAAAPPEAVMPPPHSRQRRKRKVLSIPQGSEAVQEPIACPEAISEPILKCGGPGVPRSGCPGGPDFGGPKSSGPGGQHSSGP